MMRLLGGIFLFLLLASLEVGFVYALPFPIDRTPLVLLASVFAFQSMDIRLSAWWVAVQGLLIDLLAISFVPFEFISYTFASVVLILSARRLFSNRSFWGILGTFTLSLLTLTSAEILFAVVGILKEWYTLSWHDLLQLRAWSWALGSIVLLFLFPLHEFFMRMKIKLFAA
jgi:hypothetical protein